jgi:hypothetical protein
MNVHAYETGLWKPVCAEMHIDFHLKWSLELPNYICKLKWLDKLFMKFSSMQVHENLFISSQIVTYISETLILASAVQGCGCLLGGGDLLWSCIYSDNVYLTSEMECRLVLFVGRLFSHFFQGAGHNDVELYSQYLERLKQFVSVELLNWQLLPPGEESEHNATSTVSSATTSSVTEKLL